MFKKLLLSVTKKDFEWQFIRGSGPGGQHRNKVSTGCRCIHRASGAVGVATDSRSQHQNRAMAFSRCVHSDKFQAWLRVETAKLTGEEARAQEWVSREMRRAGALRTEVKEDGRWVVSE